MVTLGYMQSFWVPKFTLDPHSQPGTLTISLDTLLSPLAPYTQCELTAFYIDSVVLPWAVYIQPAPTKSHQGLNSQSEHIQ